MKTVRLYQQDVYLKEAQLPFGELIESKERFEELGIKYKEGSAVIWLPETIFFPEGGGQPADLGTIDGVRLIDTFEHKASGAVYHRIDAKDAESFRAKADAAAKGEDVKVSCSLDWQRRFKNMQMHCGEHVLSGVFFSEYGIENRGFHLGDTYLTIDMALPEDSQYKEITDEMIENAEYRANEALWQNLPVSTVYFDTREEANSQPVRKKIKFDEDISVVFVGDPAAPVDCCACCGTHPAKTGEIGCIKIVKAENNKGMTRMTVLCGMLAFEEYRNCFNIVKELARRYTTGEDQLLDKLYKNDTENGKIRKELADLKKGLLGAEAKKLEEELKEGFNLYRYGAYSTDDLQDLGRMLEGKTKGLLALASDKENCVMIFSDGSIPCGQLVKDYANMYGGKGGGNAKQARGIFTSRENLDLFLDLIEKHLR